MAVISTFNKIAPEGIELLESRGHKTGPDLPEPEGILVRSADLKDLVLSSNLRGIARAGAGVNNIPIARCTERGIVVFNTPGSNANSVKELVVAGLILSSRRILEGCTWVQGLDAESVDIAQEVESGKKAFAGPEISGKRLGVIGLGAIGVMVANAGVALGMDVVGYDPYLSINSAWGLSRSVERATSLESLLQSSDYATIHVPLNENTRGMIGTDQLKLARPGLRFLNFARDGLVDEEAMKAALEEGIVTRYVTDFPNAMLHRHPGVIAIPHLGASTPEAETNSAVMAARQLADLLDEGIICNSVNFPECILDRSGTDRLLVTNRNVPNMVGQITTILAEAELNILNMLNRHREDVAYNIIDIDRTIPDPVVDRIGSIDGVVTVRVISGRFS
jgi:D-3-phosphoglycerate dehydrogenase / 2-oxoglutarate reductase